MQILKPRQIGSWQNIAPQIHSRDGWYWANIVNIGQILGKYWKYCPKNYSRDCWYWARALVLKVFMRKSSAALHLLFWFHAEELVWTFLFHWKIIQRCFKMQNSYMFFFLNLLNKVVAVFLLRKCWHEFLIFLPPHLNL